MPADTDVRVRRSAYDAAADLMLRNRALGQADTRAWSQHVLLAAGALLVLAVIAWAVSLASIDPGRSSDVGLISALPPAYYAALALLTLSFTLVLASLESALLLWFQLGVLVLVLFGTPSFVEYGPRTQSAWRLAGITDYISQHHSVDRGIDAFFNWPGFFILVSFVTQATGMSTPLALARWAPLFFNLAYGLPLLLIFRALALSRRQVWIGLWLFFAGNWVGQDYLAPQAFGYFIYLSIIAVLVTVFPEKRRGSRSPAGISMPPPRMQAATVGFVFLLYALVVPSHQLSPWLVIFAVTVLVLVGRAPSRWLPVAMGVMAAAWVVFGAAPYLEGHFSTVAGPVGSVGSNVHQNLGSRFEGNHGHLLVVRIRSLFTVAIGALAVYGALRIRRSGGSLRTIGLLAFVPFLTLGAQTYGGELLLRTYFFSLPFLALAGAAALAPAYARPAFAKRAVATGILLATTVVFLVARYGNEKMDAYTKQEVAAVNFLYSKAPAGSHMVSANDNLPWKFEHYADYTYYQLPGSSIATGSVTRALRVMRAAPRSSYLILSRSESAQGQLFDGWRPDTLSKFRAAIIRSGRFRIIFQNADSTLFKLRVHERGARDL